MTIIRVFETTDTPVIVRSSGAVYVRDAGGKQPVRDHRVLLELARRGERARRDAELRLKNLRIITTALRGPYDPQDPQAGPDWIGVTIKLAPLTVTPTFEDWGLSQTGVTWAEQQVLTLAPKQVPYDQDFAITRPFGRGFGTSRLREHPKPLLTSSVAVDAGGVIGAQLLEGWEPGDIVNLTDLRDRALALLAACAEGLRQAETYGAVAADLWIMVPIEASLYVINGGSQVVSNPGWFYASGSLTVPADQDEIEAQAAAWARELMREGNHPEWEPPR